MDGTLLNTLEDLYYSTNTALAAYGFPKRTIEEVRQFVGNGLRNLMRHALTINSPIAIRYPRGKATSPDWQTPFSEIKPGKSRVLAGHEKPDIAILSIGTVSANAIKASEKLAEKGIKAEVHDMIWLKPLDTAMLENLASRTDKIITVEDGAITGGLGTAVSEWVANNASGIHVVSLGVPDKWVSHGTPAELHKSCGFDPEGILKAAEKLLNLTAE